MLMSEPSDQLLTYNRFVIHSRSPLCSLLGLPVTNSMFCSELLVVFLKFLYDQDPVTQLLDTSEADHCIEIDL